MPKRRRLTGKPLLLATTTAVLAVGCGKGGAMVTGNLVPPPAPPAEVCVKASPPDAKVRIDGAVAEDGCRTLDITQGEVAIEVSAKGYAPHSEVVALAERVDVEVILVAEEEPVPKPVGNLMPPPPPPPPEPPPPPVEPTPPPPPPPVGNLMPPPNPDVLDPIEEDG